MREESIKQEAQKPNKLNKIENYGITGTKQRDNLIMDTPFNTGHSDRMHGYLVSRRLIEAVEELLQNLIESAILK